MLSFFPTLYFWCFSPYPMAWVWKISERTISDHFDVLKKIINLGEKGVGHSKIYSKISVVICHEKILINSSFRLFSSLVCQFNVTFSSKLSLSFIAFIACIYSSKVNEKDYHSTTFGYYGVPSSITTTQRHFSRYFAVFKNFHSFYTKKLTSIYCILFGGKLLNLNIFGHYGKFWLVLFTLWNFVHFSKLSNFA